MSKKQETKSAAPRQAGFLGKLLAVLPLFPVLAVVCIVPLVTQVAGVMILVSEN